MSGVYVCVRGGDPPPRRPRPATPTERVARVYTIRWLGAADARAAVRLLVTTINARTRSINCFFFTGNSRDNALLTASFQIGIHTILYNISKPNKTSPWIIDDSGAGNVMIRGCDEIVKSINTVVHVKEMVKYSD